jgi:hypothetical protein
MEDVLSPAPDPWQPDPGVRPDASYKGFIFNPHDFPLFEGRVEYDDSKGAKLVKRALDGDADADAALCNIAFKYV